MSQKVRFFPNPYKNLTAEELSKSTDSEYIKSKAEETLNNILGLFKKHSPPSKTRYHGSLYTGSPGVAYAFYHLSKFYKITAPDKSREYLDLAREYFHKELKDLEGKSFSDYKDSKFLLGEC